MARDDPKLAAASDNMGQALKYIFGICDWGLQGREMGEEV
jgi:hypothetical protein